MAAYVKVYVNSEKYNGEERSVHVVRERVSGTW